MLRGALSVAVERNGTLVPVSLHASNLRFSKAASGGAVSLSVSLALPEDLEIAALDRVVVSDGATARVIWDGEAEWPTPSVVGGLTHYALAALGSPVRLRDADRAHFYCDSFEMVDDSAWIHRPLNTPAASASVASMPDALDPEDSPPAVVLSFPEGKTLRPGQQVAMDYRRPVDAGRTLARIGATCEGGANSSVIQAQVYTHTGTSWVKNDHMSNGLSTAGLTQNAWVGTTLANGSRVVRLKLAQTSVGVVMGEADYWAAWRNIHATAALQRKDGSWRDFADYPNFGPTPAVRTDMIVEDLLGRFMSSYIDSANAVVDQGTFHLDQFTMMDGAKDADVFNALEMYEPDYYWMMGPRQPNGKHSFAYRRWPTTARYVIPSWMEFTEDGPDITLCNRIAVTWRTSKGREQRTVVTAVVPALGDRVRDAEAIDLPDGFGSLSAAQHIGARVLADTNSAATTGTIQVTGPVRDTVLGRDVWPWEIEPGELAQLPNGEALRIVEMEYDDESGVTTLGVGTVPLTADQLTGRIARVRPSDKRKPPPPRRRAIGRAKVRRPRKKKKR